MFDGTGAGDGAIRGDRRAGRWDHWARLGGGNGRGRGGTSGVGVREAAAGASALGAGGAGRFGDSGCAGLGRKSDCDGGGADHGKILGEIWREGASGVFVGRDGSESTATGGRDCGGDGDGIVAAGEPFAGG